MVDNDKDSKILLSPPYVSQRDIDRVTDALRGGWIAPAGPELTAFERDLADYCEVSDAVALSSGTAALHLGLLALGVGTGDLVVVPTLTFAATAFAVKHAGAEPVFLDVDKESGLMDLDLLDGFLAEASKEGYLPKAVISVDLFGSPTNYARLLSITDQYGIPVLCDSAEALGSKFGDMSVGACGAAAVFSFNGNKILSTSGGGALLSNDEIATSRVRKLSQQAREPVSWYQHNDVGFNYRLSNILAALGRSQLERIESLVSHRRWVRSMYQEILGALVDVSVVGDPPWGKSNAWLTVVRLRQGVVDVGELVERMNLCGIEVRHVWKPLHSQPVFHSCPVVLNGHADSWFTSSVCLPSGPCLTETDIQRICALLVENIA